MGDVVDAKVVDEWRALRDDSDRALAFYFDHILPPVVRHVEQVPEHVDHRARGCTMLISTMGLSPETTVIAASVFRPRRLVIIASEKNDFMLELAMHFLDRQRIVSLAKIRVEDVEPTDSTQIYERIRRHLHGAATGSPMMDVTGGKKIMSATAAVAAWELRIPLCYVEGNYDSALRRPIPGTERIIVLRNPSHEHARLLRDRALQWYERGSMPTAIEAFRESRDAQVEHPQLDELALELARCESALMDLDLKALKQHVEILDEMMKRPATEPLTHELRLMTHAEALRRVAGRDPLALLATFRELVRRYCEQGRFDFASLLAYRTLEELVQIGLSRASKTGAFNMSEPDLSLLTDDLPGIRERYADMTKTLGHDEAEIPGKMTFLAGLTLLGLATDLVKQVRTPPDLAKTLRHASHIAAMRNHSVLAHGTRNLSRNDVDKLTAFDHDLARAILGDDAAAVEQLERDLTLPPLRQLVH